MNSPASRQLYGVLSARSLSYAQICTASLFRNALEPLSLTLITDGPADKEALVRMMEELAPGERHSWRVVDKAEADARADVIYAKYPNLREFRNGHPCWRKITDPPLFAKDGEEMVILDPDVYFPNKFCFEPTPSSGLILMWQAANCLFPPDRVRQAFNLGIAMADHTDIGVCQATCPLDYEWLDDLIYRLGGKDLPTWSAHVEPIVWAALGMRVGGGYLDPRAWFCFNNPVSKRLRRKLFRIGPMELLRTEPIRTAKCFHAGGEPKGWLVEAEKAGILEGSTTYDQLFPFIPFKGYTRSQFERKQFALSIARSLGLMAAIGSNE